VSCGTIKEKNKQHLTVRTIQKLCIKIVERDNPDTPNTHNTLNAHNTLNTLNGAIIVRSMHLMI